VTNLSQLPLYRELQCELDGLVFSMQTKGRSIFVDVPDVATGLKLLRIDSPPGSYLGSVHKLKRLLAPAFMILESRLREQPIGVVGYYR